MTNEATEATDREKIVEAKAQNQIPDTMSEEAWLEQQEATEPDPLYEVASEDEAERLALRKDMENEIPGTMSRETFRERHISVASGDSEADASEVPEELSEETWEDMDETRRGMVKRGTLNVVEFTTESSDSDSDSEAPEG